MADLQEYIMLLFILLISIILVQTIFTKSRTKPLLPPSPRAIPIIGHLHLLSPPTHQALHKLSNLCGPLMHIRIGSIPCVVASSPEMAKELLKTHEPLFLNRPRTSAGYYLTYGSADFATASYGPYWKFMKKLCISELLGRKTLDQHLPIRHEEMGRFLQLVLQKAEAGQSIHVGGEAARVTNNVITRMTMSQRCSEDEDEAFKLRKVIQDMNELIGKFNLSDIFGFCKNLDLQGFGKKLRDTRNRFDAMMERIISERQEERRKKKEMGGNGGDTIKDVLDILLDIAEDNNSEMRLTRDNIKAFILNMFGAGTDTSAVTTEWAMAELINHSNVIEKARQEIDSVVGKERIVRESDIDNLPYLQAIVKESLRLHPAGALIGRESTENCVIGDYEIPAKTRILVNLWAIGRDPKHWENPLKFKPERFLSEDGSVNSQLDVRGQNFHYLPFGTGRRRCPGTSLALHLVQTNLAAMIQCFDWKLCDGENSTVDMEEGPGISLRRANPLICIPVARLKPFPSI